MRRSRTCWRFRGGDGVTPLSVVLVDTMTFAYLQALGQLELLRRVSVDTRRVGLTKSVLRELQRSCRLGPLVQSYCDRGELPLISCWAEDDVALTVSGVLGTPRSNAVRRNRVDSELIELAASRQGAVLSSERGIQELAAQRRVPTLDLVGFFAWAVRLGLVSDTNAGEGHACHRAAGGGGRAPAGARRGGGLEWRRWGAGGGGGEAGGRAGPGGGGGAGARGGGARGWGLPDGVATRRGAGVDPAEAG